MSSEEEMFDKLDKAIQNILKDPKLRAEKNLKGYLGNVEIHYEEHIKNQRNGDITNWRAGIENIKKEQNISLNKNVDKELINKIDNFDKTLDEISKTPLKKKEREVDLVKQKKFKARSNGVKITVQDHDLIENRQGLEKNKKKENKISPNLKNIASSIGKSIKNPISTIKKAGRAVGIIRKKDSPRR